MTFNIFWISTSIKSYLSFERICRNGKRMIAFINHHFCRSNLLMIKYFDCIKCKTILNDLINKTGIVYLLKIINYLTNSMNDQFNFKNWNYVALITLLHAFELCIQKKPLINLRRWQWLSSSHLSSFPAQRWTQRHARNTNKINSF